jgi:hypothetical protein
MAEGSLNASAVFFSVNEETAKAVVVVGAAMHLLE